MLFSGMHNFFGGNIFGRPMALFHPLLGGSNIKTLYIQDLMCDAAIGVYHSEKGRTQKIIVNIVVQVNYVPKPLHDDLAEVLDYGLLRQAVLEIICSRHFHLQETLCEELVDFCFSVPSVKAAYVRLGKPEAFEDCAAVGCESFRIREAPH